MSNLAIADWLFNDQVVLLTPSKSYLRYTFDRLAVGNDSAEIKSRLRKVMCRTSLL